MKYPVMAVVLVWCALWLSGCTGMNSLSGGSIPIGDIDGNVYLPSRAPLPQNGVTVELRSTAGELLQAVTSGANGHFVFTLVPPGSVIVRATQGARIAQVDIDRDNVENAHVELVLAEIDPAVTSISLQGPLPGDPQILLAGSTAQFTAIGVKTSGPVTGLPVSWAVRGWEIGTITTTGLFTATDAGQGMLFIQYGTKKQHLRITVLPLVLGQ